MSIDSKKNKKEVAKGATLYTRKSKQNGEKKRSFAKDGTPKLSNTDYNSAVDPQFEDTLIRYLSNNGIEVSSYKSRYILRRLRVRMGRLKIHSYKEYLDYIKANQNELAEIQESLSINVTRFFRNRDTFEKIQKDILPVLAANSNSIKIWSAGCAVGAEPYTIAMIASDVMSSNGSRISILATDVKEELLRTARFGTYAGPYLDEMEDYEVRKYFVETSNGDYKVKPHIKNIVSFQQHDLMKDDYPRNLDLIFCRNVLIYVDKKAQNVILNKFFQSLNPGGILVLGRTETLFGDWRNSVDIVSTKHRIYQKKELAEFQPIAIVDPITNVTGKRYTRLTTKSPQEDKISSASRLSTIPKMQSTGNSDRLDELKNFRITYEERKKIWEQRIDKFKKERELKKQKRENKSTSDTLRKQIKTESKATLSERMHQTTSNLRESRAKLESMRSKREAEAEESRLADYRSLLQRSNSPTRVAKIRKDLKDEQDKH